MKTRKHDWFDTIKQITLYSFQVLSGGTWCNVHDNGKPCFYKTTEERDEARRKFRKVSP